MRKVAIFGNAGGGKSTLARRLQQITHLPLYAIDVIQFPGGRYRPELSGGGQIPAEDFARLHAQIVARDEWIIEGYGGVAAVWERFDAADTLVHVDLPVALHYWGVTRRLAQGLVATPLGWPDDTPVWSSSLEAYRVVWRCHVALTPRYRQYVADASGKRVHHLTSYADMQAFLVAEARERR